MIYLVFPFLLHNIMQKQWLQKRFVIFLIIFMMCPKRSLTANDVKNDPANNVHEKNRKLHMKLSEPGFNYTDSEMEKLKIWPGGIIPYFIDDYSFDLTLRQRLRSVLGSYNSVTGIEFYELSKVPDDDKERWVLFINRRGVLGCEDYNINSFTTKGVQRVVLGYDCFGAGGGDLASTVLALAGVPPQHNAPDRDNHITVVMENIIPEKRDMFKVLKNDEWLFHHVPYDFLSAGHYGFHKYTINGSASIIPKNNDILNMAVGEGNGISPKDIWKIRMLYNFISKNRKTPKASVCSKIFKPGSKFSDFKPLGEDIIIPRVKPATYLGLPNNYDENNDENISDEDYVEQGQKLKKDSKIREVNINSITNTENQQSEKEMDTEDQLTEKTMGIEKLKLKGKNSKLFKNKGKNKLDYLPDFDTDFDKDSGRVKLYGKMKGGKKRNALHNKYQLSKLAAMSDFDTDKNNK